MKDNNQIIIDGLMARIRELESEIKARDVAIDVAQSFIVGYGTNKRFYHIASEIGSPHKAYVQLLHEMFYDYHNLDEYCDETKLLDNAERIARLNLSHVENYMAELEDVE